MSDLALTVSFDQSPLNSVKQKRNSSIFRESTSSLSAPGTPANFFEDDISFEIEPVTSEDGLLLVDLGSKGLHYVPRKLLEHEHIEILILDDNALHSIPSDFKKFNKLIGLGLASNQFSHFPKELFALSNIRGIGLAFNRLTSLPREIASLSNLTGLDLNHNHLTFLPQEIGNLKFLKEIDLSHNQLTAIPKEFSYLSSLKSVNIENNCLVKLPSDVCKLFKTLETLKLAGNPFQWPFKSSFEDNLDDLLSFLIFRDDLESHFHLEIQNLRDEIEDSQPKFKDQELVEALRDQIDVEKRINAELTRIKFQVESELIKSLTLERNRVSTTLDILQSQHKDRELEMSRVQEQHKNELAQVVELKNKEIEELKVQLESFKLKNVSLSERLHKHQKEDPDLFAPDTESLPIGDITNKKKPSAEQLKIAKEAKNEALQAQESLNFEELFTKAILAQPYSSSSYSGRAYSVLQLRRPNAAIRDCEIALKLNPEDLLVRAFARRGLGLYEQSLEDIEHIELMEGELTEDLVQLRETCNNYIV